MLPVREGAARRLLHQPWLTAALALAWCAALPWSQGRVDQVGERREAALARAGDYLEAHPHLTVPPVLEERLGAARLAALREESRVRRSRGGRVPLPQVFREQQELDRLLAAAVRTPEGLPVRRWGLRAASPEPAAFATHALLHAGWRQLAGSLVALLLLGGALERRWGSPAFAVFGAVSTAAAGGSFALANPSLATPLVGGAGLGAGLLAGFLVAGARLWRRVSYAAGAAVGGAALGSSLWLSTADVGAAAVVSWAAGGCAAGALGALGLRKLGGRPVARPGAGAARSGRRREAARRLRSQGPLGRALATHAEGRIEKAFLMLRTLLRKEPENHGALVAMWEVARDVGRPEKAEQALLRAIQLELRDGDPAAAAHWLEFASAPRETPPDLQLLLDVAHALRESGHADACVDALQRALARADAQEEPEQAARVAHAALDLDRQIAEEAAWCALGSAELPFEERQHLEEMLGHLYPPRVRAPALVAASAPAARLRIVSALPLALDGSSLVLETDGAGKKRIPLDRVEALGVAAVGGLEARPVIVIDLLLNWTGRGREVLRVLRLRADRFAAALLVPDLPPGSDALRAFLGELIARSPAVPLPDAAAARGQPFASFPSLAAYQREVLGVDEAAPGSP